MAADESYEVGGGLIHCDNSVHHLKAIIGTRNRTLRTRDGVRSNEDMAEEFYTWFYPRF